MTVRAEPQPARGNLANELDAPSDAAEMASAMKDVLEDDALRERLVQNGYRYVKQHCWRNRKQDYLQLVDGLIGRRNRATKIEASLHRS